VRLCCVGEVHASQRRQTRQRQSERAPVVARVRAGTGASFAPIVVVRQAAAGVDVGRVGGALGEVIPLLEKLTGRAGEVPRHRDRW